MLSLDMVKEDAIVFNKEVFGDIFRRKQLLEARIAGIQRTLEMVDSLELVQLERHLQAEYEHTLHQEELLWF